MRPLIIAVATGALLISTTVAQRRGRGFRASGDTWKFLAKKYDKNKDGEITWTEYARDTGKFAELDSDGIGGIKKTYFDEGGGGGQGSRGNRRRGGATPKAGDLAPDFDLPLAKKPKQRIKLSSFAGKKPVALIFGSYT